jgi:hypothetical protein
MTNLYDVMHTWNAFGFVQPEATKQQQIIKPIRYVLRIQITVISYTAMLYTVLSSFTVISYTVLLYTVLSSSNHLT